MSTTAWERLSGCEEPRHGRQEESMNEFSKERKRGESTGHWAGKWMARVSCRQNGGDRLGEKGQ